MLFRGLSQRPCKTFFNAMWRERKDKTHPQITRTRISAGPTDLSATRELFQNKVRASKLRCTRQHKVISQNPSTSQEKDFPSCHIQERYSVPDGRSAERGTNYCDVTQPGGFDFRQETWTCPACCACARTCTVGVCVRPGPRARGSGELSSTLKRERFMNMHS